MQEIILHEATDDMLDGFGTDPNPDAYEEHELIEGSIRGPKGAVVRIHKNDLAILRRNGLIATPKDEAAEPVAPELTKAEKAAQAKAEKAEKAAQAKAEKAAQAKAEKAEKAAQAKAEKAEPVAQVDADELAKALELAASIADQPAAGV